MCGICGVFNFDRGCHVDRATLAGMNESIVHRGPDDEGYSIFGNIGLAMRRLSIVDLQSGHQPIANETGTLFIVFNGEIYNHAELRSLLQARGHCYQTRSDTETILHLFEEYGAGCVRHLRGMFAFAIWDTVRRRLFVARDRLGIKPLYYQLTNRNFIFGSEIKAVLAHPEARGSFNTGSLPEYLAFGYLSGVETMLNGVLKLLPGHTLEIGEDGEADIQQYWDLPSAQPDGKSDQYYAETYRAMLEDAVSTHLMSDVPLGVFLSGGIDSSTVAALVTRFRSGPIKTFSVGYDEEKYSELSYAREMARHLGSEHYEVRLGGDEFFSLLPQLIWQEDEPITWPSSVSLYAVARLAREHVKVVLTGEGSDETLAGYKRYAWTRLNLSLDGIYRRITPVRFRRFVRQRLGDSGDLGADLRRKLQHTFVSRDGDSWQSLYFDNFYSAFSAAEQSELLANPDLMGGAYDHAVKYWEQSSGDLISRLLYTDIKTYLVELLMKQDNMSMAASIESRVPFLDHPLVEFAASIPAHLKVKGLNGKQVLKEAVKDLLPNSIVSRKKLGFPTPLARWFGGAHLDRVERLLLEPRAIERGLFRVPAVRRLFAEHRARSRDNCDRIWRLLNLELWHRTVLEGDRESEPIGEQRRATGGACGQVA